MVTSRVTWALEGKMRRASAGGDVGDDGGTGGEVGGGGVTSQAIRNMIMTARASKAFLIAHSSPKLFPYRLYVITKRLKERS
jgi:hypothetical protein